MILKWRYFLCLPGAVVAVTWVMLATTLHGFTYSTPEQSTARVIASWVDSYSRSHDGALPSSWEDLQPMLDRPIHEIMEYAAPAKRYAFVSPPLPMSAPFHGELVAINRSDIFDTTLTSTIVGFSRGLRGPGRYAIFRTEEGDFAYVWMTSDYVRELFTRANVALPIPDGEPERIWVKKARRAHRIWNIVWGTVIAGLAWWLWRIFRRETSWGMMIGFWLEDRREKRRCFVAVTEED